MTVRSQADLEALQRVGLVVGDALEHMTAAVRPGITTGELDRIGERFMRERGATSAPQRDYQFPGFNCISVNEEIVHGIPGKRMLKEGDVLKLDVTAELDGYIADAARTVLLPGASARARRLRDCAQRAFHMALAVAQPGTPVRELGRVVETEVQSDGFSVVRELTGHGVGRKVHEPPEVPNFFSLYTQGVLEEGMVIALEPIISEKPSRIVEERDGWTIRTQNRSLAAHYEHTIVIRREGPLILTAGSTAAQPA